jgi:CheY-like chemotaxis protein
MIQKIFVAEDDADDRMFFEDALKVIKTQAHLTFANDGLELMRHLEQVIAPPPPDLIFLDLNMPRKNGFECLEEIRGSERLKDIPVVIFSTTSSDNAINETYRQGANYYVCKPLSFPLLVKAIETVLEMEMWQRPRPDREQFFLAIT